MFDKFKSKHYLCARKANRGVAQLAARHVRDVEVGSSSLLTPTLKRECSESSFLFLYACSSGVSVIETAYANNG